MAEKFSFRKFKMEDLDDYKRLYSDVYSKKIDDDFFCWKNLKNPNRDSEVLIYFVLNENGKIVGANSFFPAKLAFQRRKFLIVQSGDTMVLKEYRRRGIWKKVLNYAIKDLKKKGYRAIYGIPHSGSLPGLKSVGFEDLYEMNKYVRVLDFENVIARNVKSIPGTGVIGRTVNYLDGLLILKKRDNNNIRNFDLSDRYSFDKALNSKVEHYILNTSRNRIHSIKDKSYLRWRYNENPDEKYEMAIVRRKKAIIAVIIVRIEKHLGKKSGNIVEYFIDKSDDFNLSMKYVLKNYKMNNFNYLSIWDYGDERIKKIARKNFFFKKNIDLYFTVKLLDDSLRFLYDVGRWHIVEGDADTA